jgi:hypothetical protein
MSKTLQAFHGPFAAPRGNIVRRGAAIALRSASVALARLSRQIHAADAARSAPLAPALEFYAEAGAPEGALYIDGELVGYVAGVTRL